MGRVHPSVRQWVLSFLAVDLLFWVLVGWGCVSDPVSCLETWTFGSYFFYFPVIFIPVPDLGDIGGIATSTYLFPLIGIATHVLFGAFVGWVLRKTSLAWAVSLAVSVVVLFAGSYGAAYYNYQAEMARESVPSAPTSEELTWTDWEEYADPQGLFTFQRAPGMGYASAAEPFAHLPDVAVAYSTSEASYLQPNYAQDSWFVVSSQLVDETACYASLNGDQLAFNDAQMIGATTFRVASAVSAGAGNRYEQSVYRTHLNGICFEIATTLHYASDFNDIDESAMNASQDEARTMLANMVSTFRFNL
mgnify:CR=1 FL=1